MFISLSLCAIPNSESSESQSPMSRSRSSRAAFLVVLSLGVVIVLAATFLASRNILVTISAGNAHKLLVSAGLNADVIFWNPRDLSVVTRRSAPEWIISASFRPDGRRLFLAGGANNKKEDRFLDVLGVRLLDSVAASLAGGAARRESTTVTPGREVNSR